MLPRPVLLALVLLPLVARAEPAPSVPLYVEVQGRLLDASDQPVQGQTTLTYSIYDVAETPTGQQPTPPVWTATYDLTLTNGLYAAELGDVSTGQPPLPADLFDGTAPRWLGVSVNHGAELSPRLRIGSVPNAFLAQHALDANHADESDHALDADHALEADHAAAADSAKQADLATDATTVGGESPAELHDASKLTGTLPSSVLGAGSADVTTVGTITQGTWNGTPVDDAHVASAAAWNAKLDAVAHDATLAGDGKAAPLSVVYGQGANTAAAGNDPRFASLDGKFADYLPLAGGSLSGGLTVGGAATLKNGATITGQTSLGTLTVGGDASVAGVARGIFLSSNRSYVGLEHDVLLNAPAHFAVTETGPAPLALAELFDGAMAPAYSDAAPSASAPEVIEIDGLPDYHCQAGCVFGFTGRYWNPTRFKVEYFDTYNGRNKWTTLVDQSSADYAGADYAGWIQDAVPSQFRLTVYASNGQDGRWGLSEIFFDNAEITSPYQNVIPKTEAFLGNLTNGPSIASAHSGRLKFDSVAQNTNGDVFQVQSDGTLKILRAGIIQATAQVDCITNASYCTMIVGVNGSAKLYTLSPPGGGWAELSANLAWKVSAGDVLSYDVQSVGSMDDAPWSTLNVTWTGLE